MNSEVKGFLTTLRRIPRDVVRRIATREFRMHQDRSCVCGWAIREALANGVAAEDIRIADDETSVEACKREFGGTMDEWLNVYVGVLPEQGLFGHRRGKILFIEEAFARRVAECVR